MRQVSVLAVEGRCGERYPAQGSFSVLDSGLDNTATPLAEPRATGSGPCFYRPSLPLPSRRT
jgi:hypothetical protein